MGKELSYIGTIVEICIMCRPHLMRTPGRSQVGADFSPAIKTNMTETKLPRLNIVVLSCKPNGNHSGLRGLSTLLEDLSPNFHQRPKFYSMI